MDIRNDEELDKLLSHVTKSEGGVIFNIHSQLLPERSAKTKRVIEEKDVSAKKQKRVEKEPEDAGSAESEESENGAEQEDS